MERGQTTITKNLPFYLLETEEKTMSKHDLIMLLGNKSETKYHELIIECMDFNNKTSTRELTIEELTKFCKLKGFL